MSFRIKLFGGVSVEGPGGLLTGRAVQRRRLALLALLASARDRGLSRERLVGYLWPDSDPERARRLLSDSVYRLNLALGGEGILAAGDALRLNAELVSVDLWELLDALAGGAWQRAAELAADPFLDGFSLPDSVDFERWVEGEREALRRERARALETLAREAAAGGDEVGASGWWRTLAAADPLSSRVALELMRSLERAGDRPAALRHGQIHAALVREELEVEPDPRVLELCRRLQAPPAPGAPELSRSLVAPHRGEPEATDGGNSSGGAGALRGPGSSLPIPTAATPLGGREGGNHRGEGGAGAAAPEGSAVGGRRRGSASRALAIAAVAALLAIVAWGLTGGAGGRDGSPPPAPPRSLVVLPFEDLSLQGEQEYYADGITEELLLRLSRVDGLRVVGRTSSFAFKGQEIGLPEIARRLDVEVAVGGSVLRAGNRIRVFAELVDASSGFRLWSERYEVTEQDVFALQDEIAGAIMARLRGRLSEPSTENGSVRPVSDDPVAYNLYLRGRYEWHRRSREGLLNAVDFFRQATELAPEHARAYAGLGDAWAVLGFYDHLPPAEAFPRAIEAARQAIRIDPALAAPHATLGYAALYYEWDWEGAEAAFRRSIELDPGYSTARQWYSNHLTAMGDFEAAVREMRMAQDLDPLSLIANAALGWVLFHAGDFPAAIHQFDRTLELDPAFEVALVYRALSHAHLGRLEEAESGARRSVEVSGASSTSLAMLARILAMGGREEEARRTLESLEAREREGSYVPSYELATAYEALGEAERALDLLDRARGERSHSLVFLKVDPRLEGLRDTERFQALVRRVGLPSPATAPRPGAPGTAGPPWRP